jgi:hypothetical protein
MRVGVRVVIGCGVTAALLATLTSPALLADGAAEPVQVQMRNVALHVDEKIVLHVHRLRGELRPTKAGAPPFFDDKTSFLVRIDSAEIEITTDSLSRLLNGYVFGYTGSPLSKLDVSTEGTRLKVTGRIRKGVSIPFSMISEPTVDSHGNLRLHPASFKTAGIPATGLFSLLHLRLDQLIHLDGRPGVRIDGDDFVLEPSALVPPPRIEGHLQSVRVVNGGLVQTFGPGHAPPLTPSDSAPNYMYYRGGVLRFGKLTMTDTDLELIDQNPEDPFDFFQDRYNDQLVAGYSKNTPAHGLHVYMPDYRRLRRSRTTDSR